MRRAHRPPRYCSSCFQQQPEKRHIDFEAFWDGPVQEVANGIKVPIDDLIVCETCVSSAARLLGYTNERELLDENRELGEALEEATQEIGKLGKIIHSQKSALDKSLDLNVKKGPGRPRSIRANAAA